uniref:UDP-glucose:glycoprotein glucosyltransferase n=1 Tax=Peronospora matthiolae TaxID=2874970 RepID=A0AAV1UZR4_9STRA
MRLTTWQSAGVAVLVATAQPFLASARNVHVNLTASWPSSPLFPLLETSEFLAEENPLYFWQFLDEIGARTSYVTLVSEDVDELGVLAMAVAETIAPGSKSILEVMLATRTYSVKVEMFRQLGLDSGFRPCEADADTWAVFYQEPHCVESVACSLTELEAILVGKKQESNNQACIATGVNDVELSVDHKYPYITSGSKTPVSVILYGLVGTEKFHNFHSRLVKQAQHGKIRYMVRHYPRDSPLETLLQGYGVALDVKNMEYTTIDDSRKTGDDDGVELDEGDDEEGSEEDDVDDEEVEGIFFKPLMTRHKAIAGDLRQFYDILVKKADGEQEHELKAWHLNDMGASAVRAIVDAKNPLKMLETLSQDFPLQAKKLAFSRKSISTELRDGIFSTRMLVANNRLTNMFIMNGIAVDPMERSFNVFDFMKTLKKEWSVAKQLGRLPLNQTELEEMLMNVRETSQTQSAVRIHVRGPMDGTTPLYLNNIETDAEYVDWPSDVSALRRPAWNLIFIRKNMYECVLVLDPLTGAGRTALSHIGYMRMRGAPVQWALLISSNELMASRTPDDRRALVEKYKAFRGIEKATPWHFAKLLMLAQSRDATDAGARGQGNENALAENEDVDEAEEDTDRARSTQIAAAFMQRVGVIDKPNVLVEQLVDAYAEAAPGIGTYEENEEEALACLKGDRFDNEVLAMTDFIHAKHVPLGSFVFNGVVQKDLDIQRSTMANFGRDQPLYVDLAHRGMLDDDMDLVEELMAAQDTYPVYSSIFESPERSHAAGVRSGAQKHLFADDVDGRLEAAARSAISYLHAPGSRSLPKKQTIIFPADLDNLRDVSHAYRLVKTVLEDSKQFLRVGIVPQLNGDDKGRQMSDTGKLVTAILAAVGNSDCEAYLKFILEALDCVVKQRSVDATKTKLVEIWKKTKGEDGSKDPVHDKVLILLNGNTGRWLTTKQRNVLSQFDMLLRSRFPPLLEENSQEGSFEIALPHLFINGKQVSLPSQTLLDEDVATILDFDLKYRSEPVAKALIEHTASMKIKAADKLSFDVMKTIGIVDKYMRTERASRLTIDENALNAIRLPGDPSLHVAVYVDPLSEAAQVISSMLRMLHSQLNATIELVLVPEDEYTEFPLKRFYRYLFEKRPSLAATSVEFRKLPIQPIFTMKIDTPEAWNVQTLYAGDDLDNLRVDPESLTAVKSTTRAVFRLESLLVYGQCRDMTFDLYAPPNGLQLVLEREVGAQLLHRDTVVMQNLGYFQLQATPGAWSLRLAKGRAAELFDIVDPGTDLPLESHPVIVYDFGSQVVQLLVRKKSGMEREELLRLDETVAATDELSAESDAKSSGKDDGALRSYWSSMINMMGKHDNEVEKKPQAAGDETSQTELTDAVSARTRPTERSGETIHVFSVASGYLYERFVKIMMLSVLKRTKNPVTFWLLENFLSPDFKASIPVLREQFGMDIRLVTYKWPNWLRQQTEKQRIIWGYKILFLDVLFPLGVQKVIYVDADQVVRADLKELLELDMEGKPYGYTPFCDSRNLGFQFWRQGYWKDHLRGKPYHISALYVVDLVVFRRMAAGDILRATYSQLSADPNSLANLDQDLPNYVQRQIPIFSLPQEWLWCESWCSDETKAVAKTIDLCNNPKHKEPKLDMAKRIIAGELFDESWIELDQEIKDVETQYAAHSAV